MKNTAQRFQVGDMIRLGDAFPVSQRGWLARVERCLDHTASDGSPLYSVRFQTEFGAGGWLNVAESVIVPAIAEAK